MSSSDIYPLHRTLATRFPRLRSAIADHPLALAAILLLAWTLILRLPFAGIVDDDEVFFALAAQKWLATGHLYSATFDIKPPLLFGLYALAQAVFGTSVATIKGMEIIAVAAGAWTLFRMAWRRDERVVAVWAAALYPIYSLSLGGTCAPNVLLQMPFIIMAFDAAISHRKGWRDAALAGIWIAAAILIKQSAVFEAAGIVAILLMTPAARFTRLMAFATGATAILAIALIGLTLSGDLKAALSDLGPAALPRVGAPLGSKALGLDTGFTRFLPQMKPALVLLALGVVAAARSRQAPPLLTLGLLWTLCAAAGMIYMRSLSDFYGMALVPPLLWVSGLTLVHLIRFRAQDKGLWIIGFACLAIAVPAWFDRGQLWTDPVKGRDDRVAIAATTHRLHDLGMKAGDTLFVPNRGLGVYLAAGTIPTARFVHPIHLMCDFPTDGVDSMTDALSYHPRFIAVADRGARMACETPQRHAELNTVLSSDYTEMGTVSGEWDSFTIYRLK